MFNFFKAQSSSVRNAADLSDSTLLVREDSPSSIEITWKIENFFNLNTNNKNEGITPKIKFAGFDCYITINQHKPGYIGLCVVCHCPKPVNPKVNCQLFLKSKEGILYKAPIKDEEYHITSDGTILFCEILWKAIIDRKMDSMIPEGVLTVICKLSVLNLTDDKNVVFKTNQSSSSERSEEALFVPKEVPDEARNSTHGQSDMISREVSQRYGEMKACIDCPSNIEVLWQIEDFFNLPCTLRKGVISPNIYFSEGEAFIALHALGTHDKPGLTRFMIVFQSPKPGILRDPEVNCEISLQTKEGTPHKSIESINSQLLQSSSGYFQRFFSRSEIESKRESLVPGGVMTVCIKLRAQKHAVEGPFSQSEVGSSAQTEAGSSSLTESHRRKGERDTISGGDSDVTIKIRGKEFNTCMSILNARVPAFASELELAKREKGVVILDDLCGVFAFQEFLNFINTGKVDSLSKETAFELYVMADKYKLEGLKPLCLKSTEDKEPEPFLAA